ncbi:MAG: Na(+)/H(+) antiporter subunit D [Hyphomicrobiales bacterium]|nr:Na(+)/H(+) antiporter subunit D [Hyphomicrobiales bacterium]MCY4053401.1 Na(+)/H(+) antiporter subunit D [Hyphomicrobiales bacterium]
MSIPPFLFYLAGALVLPLVPKGAMRSLFLSLVPVLALTQFVVLPFGEYASAELFGYTLILLRLDALAYAFSLIFSIAAFLAALFAWHIRDTTQQIATLIYSGVAIGAVQAGDLITLFCFWEATAFASVFLVWARRTDGAYFTGMRYLIFQMLSGLLLLAGIILHINATGSNLFVQFPDINFAAVLILLAFGIKCAFPLLHDWLQDAYPASTPTGTVVLSVFTTKLAVYALARGFPGLEALVYIGALMALFPIFYAVIENDLRRVLAFSLNNQLGFMVVGVGIGTPLALNGTVTHAFCHVLYKALLFMSMGAVLLRAGTTKGSELGGLYKSMPYTTVFCVIGAASISAFPLFSGFISKSLILSAADKQGYTLVWFALLFASAGVFHYCGIKIPYFAFFARDSGIRCREAPWNMLLAMGLTALLCVGIGVFPQPLYNILPYGVSYVPYTADHVVFQLQLLLFSALAFMVLMSKGIYPAGLRSVNLSSDIVYRKWLPRVLLWTWGSIEQFVVSITAPLRRESRQIFRNIGVVIGNEHGSGVMLLWVGVLLVFLLALTYLAR